LYWLLLLFGDVGDDNDDVGDENNDDDDDGSGVGVYSSIVENIFGCCCCCILSQWGCLVFCVWLLRLIIVRIACVAGLLPCLWHVCYCCCYLVSISDLGWFGLLLLLLFG